VVSPFFVCCSGRDLAEEIGRHPRAPRGLRDTIQRVAIPRSSNMRSLLLTTILMLLASLTVSAEQKEGSSAANAAPTATGVLPNDVILTIKGFCDSSLLLAGTATGSDSAKSSTSSENAGAGQPSADHSTKLDPDCETKVTRAQFEALIDVLGARMNESSRIRTAVRYPEQLVFAQKAQEVGLDKTPEFGVMAKYSYLSLLHDAYNSYLLKQANDISDAEVQKEYKEHPETFEVVRLYRIYIPDQKTRANLPASPQKVQEILEADRSDMLALAKSTREKAAAGASFTKLEQDVYRDAGKNPDEVPEVDLGEVNRTEISADQQQVFNLKIGEISQLIPDPAGWHICKITSKKLVPPGDARSLLVHLRMQKLTDAAKGSVETKFSDPYFNVPNGMNVKKSPEAAATR
jgi:hypothetical protein